MKDFTQVYDQHALDHLWHEWNDLRQGAKETVSDFQTRFEEIIEALEDHKFSIPEETRYTHFKNKVLHSAKLREKNDIQTVEAAVAYLAITETSNFKAKAFLGYLQPKGGQLDRNSGSWRNTFSEESRKTEGKRATKGPKAKCERDEGKWKMESTR